MRSTDRLIAGDASQGGKEALVLYRQPPMLHVHAIVCNYCISRKFYHFRNGGPRGVFFFDRVEISWAFSSPSAVGPHSFPLGWAGWLAGPAG
jgi:hypothetical protein